MSLPLFQTNSKDISQLQTTWSAQLNPVIAFPPNQGQILFGIAIKSGSNVINHGLDRKLQGWVICRMVGAFAQLYETPSPLPDKTLVLTASGPTTINLLVF